MADNAHFINRPESTRCAGSDVWADRCFDGQAVCGSCYQLVQVYPDGCSHRFLEHSRPLEVDRREDRLWTPEFDDRGRAA